MALTFVSCKARNEDATIANASGKFGYKFSSIEFLFTTSDDKPIADVPVIVNVDVNKFHALDSNLDFLRWEHQPSKGGEIRVTNKQGIFILNDAEFGPKEDSSWTKIAFLMNAKVKKTCPNGLVSSLAGDSFNYVNFDNARRANIKKVERNPDIFTTDSGAIIAAPNACHISLPRSKDKFNSRP